jgi:hypothetical protein
MYKGSSTSFDYVKKVEDQVPRCGVPCVAESDSRGSQRRAAAAAEEEEASIESTVEEIDVETGSEDTGGDLEF